METIQAGPHYELPASELAKWLEEQGADSWWSVDGDPLLTGRLPFPCPADELVLELRKINRTLLVQAPRTASEAKGQLIDASKIQSLSSRFASDRHFSGPPPAWADDRLLYMCWKGSPHEWLLVEDSRTAQQYREEAAANAK